MRRPAACYSPAPALVAAVVLNVLFGDPRRLHLLSGFPDDSYFRVAVRDGRANRRLARALQAAVADA